MKTVPLNVQVLENIKKKAKKKALKLNINLKDYIADLIRKDK